jgi:hypothetical protein
MSSETVTLTAKFEDGSQVVQTIVPDHPLPQVAFVKPKPQKQPEPVTAVQKPKHGSRPVKTTSSNSGNAGTMTGGRDGTMDPFK